MKSLSTKHKTFLVAILCLFAFSKNLKAQDTLRMRALQNVINDMYLFWVLDSGDTKINDVVCYYSLLDSVGELTINYRGIQDLSKPDMQKANLPQKTKKYNFKLIQKGIYKLKPHQFHFGIAPVKTNIGKHVFKIWVSTENEDLLFNIIQVFNEEKKLTNYRVVQGMY